MYNSLSLSLWLSQAPHLGQVVHERGEKGRGEGRGEREREQWEIIMPAVVPDSCVVH